MNLHVIDGLENEFTCYGWSSFSSWQQGLALDYQFLELSKTQNSWYSLHPSPNPVGTRPGQVMKYWSNDAPHCNSYFSKNLKALHLCKVQVLFNSRSGQIHHREVVGPRLKN